ncbi:MAG: hypothetical protein DRG37_04195 [Deltaproteobacteria bacterium]|nr:MAG: hypothetical protein DRG37_04195 [Deltaproteobacteria bacterium]
MNRGQKVRFVGFLASICVLVGLYFAVHALYGSLSLASLRAIIDGMSWVGIPFYIACFTLGVIFFVPATPVALIGGIVFGPWLGFAVLQISSIVAAFVIFLMVRAGLFLILDKKELSDLLPRGIYSRFSRNAVLFIVYARTFMFPAAAINYSASALDIGLGEYLLGTLLGSLPHNLAVALLCGVAYDVILAGDIRLVLQWKLVPVALLTIFNIWLAHVFNSRWKKT